MSETEPVSTVGFLKQLEVSQSHFRSSGFILRLDTTVPESLEPTLTGSGNEDVLIFVCVTFCIKYQRTDDLTLQRTPAVKASD
jgi:hypothetical protein